MATTKVIKDLTELNPGDPDYVLNSTNAVTVSSASGSNKYYFNGVYDGKFGLRKGTTVLTGVPVDHPIAVLNDGLTGITYTGTFFNTLVVGGVTYNFYTGDVTITVTADFGVASYYCYYHGYMGGENNLVSVYSTAGLKMPTGSSAYAAPPTVAPGMMRNLVGTASEGSVSVMQHYNGTEWKNFVNVTLISLTVDYLVVAGGGGGGFTSGGGGGAGGLRTSFGSTTGGGDPAESTLTLQGATNYTVTVGDPGAGAATSSVKGATGTDSVFSNITASGGGGGGSRGSGLYSGLDGGSGGGEAGDNSGSGGAAVTFPAVQGYAGGEHSDSGTGAAGGGGASAIGSGHGGNSGGAGGAGLEVNILGGTGNFYAGGGGGGGQANYSPGSGGSGGGGSGGTSGPGNNGTTNTGGGGGGDGNQDNNGGNGGSGVVILRYSSTFTITAGGSLTSSTATVGTDKVTTFTAGSDTITFS